MAAVICVDRAWATLRGCSHEPLRDALTVYDPRRFYNLAYRNGRWDGKIRLYDGSRFPAGLVPYIVRWFDDRGRDVTVKTPESPVINTSDVQPDYLGLLGADKDSELWSHQMDAIHAALEHPRGIIKVPTGGGKTEIVAALAKFFWFEFGWRTVIVVPKKGLASQTVARLKSYYAGDIGVGQCGDKKKDIDTITVATAQTLIGFKDRRRKQRDGTYKTIPGNVELREMLENYEVIMLDETHHASSSSWYDIAMASNAFRRYGLSGTPLRNDEMSDLRLIGATGPIICNVDSEDVIRAGLAAQPKIALVMNDFASGPELSGRWVTVKLKSGKCIRRLTSKGYQDAYMEGVVCNRHHNAAVVMAVKWLVSRGKRTLILCRRKDHFRELVNIMEDSGINFMHVWGDTEVDVREFVKRSMGHGTVDAVLSSTIWDEGEDVPGVDAMVLAEGVKSVVNVLQRVGRGMRRKRDGANEVWIVDFVQTCHWKLIEHALKRAEAYTSEGYEVTVVEDWPEDSHVIPDDLLPFEDWE